MREVRACEWIACVFTCFRRRTINVHTMHCHVVRVPFSNLYLQFVYDYLCITTGKDTIQTVLGVWHCFLCTLAFSQHWCTNLLGTGYWLYSKNDGWKCNESTHNHIIQQGINTHSQSFVTTLLVPTCKKLKTNVIQITSLQKHGHHKTSFRFSSSTTANVTIIPSCTNLCLLGGPLPWCKASTQPVVSAWAAFNRAMLSTWRSLVLYWCALSERRSWCSSLLSLELSREIFPVLVAASPLCELNKRSQI